ncbi:hypothetical protein GCM10023093_15580 [Nemorincola caseinilytica]|uniref:HEPN domain-containing protein n=1 Tax=Nemorincola caseinilytica TaxID=2054315 RepID=A0ABP8NBT9_9BACT
MVYNRKEIIKTRDIDLLLSQCGAIDPLFDSIDSLNVNEFAVSARYPDLSFLPDIDEAKALYQLALRIDAMVRQRMVFA